MPTPFVHGVLPAACVFLTPSSAPSLTRARKLRYLALAAFLANAPDLDLLPALVFPHLWHDVHRAWGHNLFTLFLATALGSWALRQFVSPAFSRPRAWGIAAFLVLSHVILDSMSAPGNAENLRSGGVPLLWPVSDQVFHMPWKVFPAIKRVPGLHPAAGLLLSQHYWLSVMWHEAAVIIVVISAWATIVRLPAWIGSRSRHPEAPATEENSLAISDGTEIPSSLSGQS